MTYKGAIDEVKILENHPSMPDIFKPSLKKIAETLEMEHQNCIEEPDLSAYANEHGFVLFDERSAEKALMALRKERENGWIPIADDKLPDDYERVLITINGCRGLIVREARYHKAQNEFEVLHNHERWEVGEREVGEKGLLAWRPLPQPYMEGDVE